MSTALYILNRLLRLSLWLLASLLIFAALYVSLGRQLTPLLAEYRQEIEQQLQQRLAQKIQIESLKGSWYGFSPMLEANYVTLGSGDDAIQVEQLHIQPDVVASLLARELRFKSVALSGLQIHLQEDATGRWALQGLHLEGAEQTAFHLNDWLNTLQQVSQLSVLDSRIIIQAQGQQPLALTYAEFTLKRSALQQRLDLRAVLPDGQSLELSAQGQLLKGDWRHSDLALYLKLPSSNLAQWIPETYLQKWQLSRLKLDAELWFRAQQGQMQAAALRLAHLELQGQFADAPVLHVQGEDALAFYQNKAGVQTAWFEHLLVQVDELAQHDWRMRLDYIEQDNPVWNLAVAQLDLADLHYLAERIVQLPDVAADVLQTMQPTGELNNLHLQWQPEAAQAERLSFFSNLSQVGFSAWHDVPAASAINGQISGNLEQGELRLASHAGFSLHLANLFAAPWQYQEAHAQLLWAFDQHGFTLKSPYLQVLGEEGAIAGDFLIRLLHDPAEEDYMDLRVGLRAGDARFAGKYLPSRAPAFSDELERWLKGAIQSGHIEQGYFQYQGSLNKGAPAESRSLSLYFAVQDVELEYQPGWPALSKAAGEVVIEDSGVRISLNQGQILNTPVLTAYAEVAHVPEGQVPVLQLHAELQSNLDDGLYFLQKTPIAKAAQEMAGWQGKGHLPAVLDLTVPLAAQQQVQLELVLDAQRVELYMPEINVQLRELTGEFKFDSQRGLSAPKISGQFLGQSFSGHIDAQGTAKQLSTHIDVQGLMPVDSLTQWANITQPLPVSGSLPYRLRVLLDGEDSQLRIDSSLLGVNIDLPAPFGKKASTQSYADWRMTLSGAERRYWLDYADQLSFALAAAPDQLLGGRGQVRVGGGLAQLPTQAGLQLRGRFNQFDLVQWQQVLQRYQLPEQGKQQLLTHAQFEIRHFTGLGLNAEHLSVNWRPQATGWQLLLESQTIKGKIVDKGAGQPMSVDLAHLYVPKNITTATDAQDVLSDFDISSIPALDIRLAALYLADESLGAWSLSTRPQPHGVLFDKLNLSLKGLNVSGQAGWERVNGQPRSWYKGRLQGDDLSDVLLAWKFAPTVTSQAFRVDADVRWPGSPAALALTQLSGDLDVSFRKGQLVTVEGGAQALRVFGLLNFDSIGRRLRLDFSDLIDKGLAYDRIKGKLQVAQGVYRTHTPLQLEGPSSNIDLQGQINLVNEQINATMLVALPLSQNLPLAAIAVGAPAVAGALFVAERLIGNRLDRFASATYYISGDWQQPKITLKKNNKEAKQ